MTGAPDYTIGRGSPGIGRLFIDDAQVGELEITATVPLAWGLGENLTCGYDSRTAVTGAYESPFAFTGTIYRVEVDVDLS